MISWASSRNYHALMKHGFRLPPYFSRILRALAVALEGTATTIDASFRVVEQELASLALSPALSDKSPEMRESLRRLFADDGSIRYKRLIRLIRAHKETTPMASSERR